MRAAQHIGSGLAFCDDAPVPTPEPGEALVRIRWCGICGSDVQRLRSPPQENRLLGHECVGIVEKIGPHSILVGDPVVVNPLVGCDTCEACAAGTPQHCGRPRSIGKEVAGGFGEFVAVPVANLHRLPGEQLLPIGTLADVAAVSLHAMDQVAGGVAGKRVVVIGDGPTGLMTATLARFEGAVVEVVGRHPQLARYLPELSFQYSDEGHVESDADVCFEAVGRAQEATLNLAIRRTRPRGVVVVQGVAPAGYRMPIEARQAFKKELRLIGANSFDRSTSDGQFSRAIDLLVANHQQLEALITHRFPIELCVDALRTFREKKGAIKVLMHF